MLSVLGLRLDVFLFGWFAGVVQGFAGIACFFALFFGWYAAADLLFAWLLLFFAVAER